MIISSDSADNLAELHQLVHDLVNECIADGFNPADVHFDGDRTVTIVEETLTDGSKVRNIRIREMVAA